LSKYSTPLNVVLVSIKSLNILFNTEVVEKTREYLINQNLLDNYVSGYPVLICAALESISIGMYKDTFKY
jgi:hypothetical protein